MHFEIILRSDQTYEKHFSYGLVFIPGPVWIKGASHLVNMSNKPTLQKGCVKKLINSEGLQRVFKDNLEAIIIIRNIGHGSNKDLQVLKKDLQDEGFKISIFGN